MKKFYDYVRMTEAETIYVEVEKVKYCDINFHYVNFNSKNNKMYKDKFPFIKDHPYYLVDINSGLIVVSAKKKEDLAKEMVGNIDKYYVAINNKQFYPKYVEVFKSIKRIKEMKRNYIYDDSDPVEVQDEK